LKTILLNEIQLPEFNDPYYLSYITGMKYVDIILFTIYYNDTLTNSLPDTINFINNVILSSNNINEEIVTKSHPNKGTDDLMIIID